MLRTARDGTRTLVSQLDGSVNWIQPFGKGSLETRYVIKHKTIPKYEVYPIAYVSSSIGCNMGCKFCWLTQQKQTQMFAVTPEMYAQQVQLVTEHYKQTQSQHVTNRININFMARGEAFANKYVVNHFSQVHDAIKDVCDEVKLEPKLNISTIMPHTIKHHKLQDIFQDKKPFLYYSLYSVNDAFREKWMPNAMHWRQALDKLKEYQEDGGNIITLHWALIGGENDQMKDVLQLAKVLEEYNFNAKFNIVRYNNHANLPYKEASTRYIHQAFNIINAALGNHRKSYIVNRVDSATFASCGQFVRDDDL